MFYKYEIKRINNQDVLYLYLTLKYEFANEIVENNNLMFLSKNYIKTNNINFKGNLIYYVIDGIVVKKLQIKNDTNLNENYLPDRFLINIKYNDNTMSEITLRDYLIGVLFYYYSNEIGNEVLKSICILFNTYAYKMMSEDNYINSNNSFVNYNYHTYYKDLFYNYDELINRFNNIINEVSCIYLAYNNNYILPFIHFSNCGKTLINKKYPYLSSVKSLWDLCSTTYININDYTYDEINKIFNTNIDSSSIGVVDNGKYIMIGNKKYSLMEIKDILKLNSLEIVLLINNNYVRFITKGMGNGLGLSIFGASYIEQNGGKYYNILNYFFPKVKLFKYIKELSK